MILAILAGGAASGTKTRALTPSFCAAKATAAPWLPPEAVAQPAATACRVMRLWKAPRALNEPVACRHSSLNDSGGAPAIGEAVSRIGVRRIKPRMRAWADRMSEGVTAGVIARAFPTRFGPF